MNSRTRIIIGFMRNNLHRNLSLSELAESAKISASHLGHLFKSETGMAPGQYLMALRMESARGLLASSTMSVKRIIFEVGFNDKSNFVRSFKKAYGLTPSEYRVKNFDPSKAERIARLTTKKPNQQPVND
jgi:transcriptional regulator GlxA family with amidase domain